MGTRKSADDRKAEIVGTMLRLADELGPDRLTTLAVAKAVGVTQPGIFRHFPTKQDLWLAVAAQIAQTMTAEWERVLATNAPPPANASMRCVPYSMKPSRAAKRRFRRPPNNRPLATMPST